VADWSAAPGPATAGRVAPAAAHDHLLALAVRRTRSARQPSRAGPRATLGLVDRQVVTCLYLGP
jgi:hypothetical protein